MLMTQGRYAVLTLIREITIYRYSGVDRAGSGHDSIWKRWKFDIYYFGCSILIIFLSSFYVPVTDHVSVVRQLPSRLRKSE